MYEQNTNKRNGDDNVQEGAVSAYLLDHEAATRAKVLNNTIKHKRKEKVIFWI